MKLRYRMSADLYIPQYQKKDETWEDFKVKDLVGATILERVAQVLANIENRAKWTEGQWYFEPVKGTGTVKEDMSIFFKKEIYVMAFLGAAQSTWGNEPKEFKL